MKKEMLLHNKIFFFKQNGGTKLGALSYIGTECMGGWRNECCFRKVYLAVGAGMGW